MKLTRNSGEKALCAPSLALQLAGRAYHAFHAVFAVAVILPALLLVSACSKEPPPAAPQLTVTLVHTPELKEYLGSQIPVFQGSGVRLPDGRPVKIELIERSAEQSARSIANGSLKTSAWLAPSLAMVNLVNSNLSNLGPRQVDCLQLFSTPLVVAVQQSESELFGAVEQRFSWREFMEGKIAEAAEAGTRPKVSFMHGSPLTSTSGLAALTQLAQLAAFTKERIIDLETLTNEHTLERLKRYEGLAGGYGTSDAAGLDQLGRFGPERAFFSLTTEREVAKFNQKQGGNRALTALYPDEGVHWLDYNLCVSDADWATAAHRAAVRKLVEFLSSPAAQQAAKQAGFRPSVVPIGDVAPLTSEFGVNTALPSQSFQPAPGDVAAYLLENWLALMRPSATLVAFDTSGSMEDLAPFARDYFTRWVAVSPENNTRGLLTFSSEKISESRFEKDARKFVKQLNSIQSRGGGAVYDGIKRGYELLSERSLQDYRRTLLVITDGDDRHSQISLDLLIDIAHQRAITDEISLVIVAAQREGTNLSDLERLARESGGVFRSGFPAELEAILNEVLERS